nr:hypothetical protein [Tanacetum cinerariifolium]
MGNVDAANTDNIKATDRPLSGDLLLYAMSLQTQSGPKNLKPYRVLTLVTLHLLVGVATLQLHLSVDGVVDAPRQL